MADKGVKWYLKLLLDAKSAKRLEQEAQRALNEGTDPRRAVSNLQKVDAESSKLGTAFKRLGAAIVAAFAIQRIKAFATEMFRLGTSAEETGAKFDTVFGRTGPKMQKFLDQWATLAGLNKTVAQDFAATTGAILQGMGFTEEASADASESILRLAGDLQSFNNIPIERTFDAIKSGLAGSWEPMDRLGIVIRQADVDTRALIDTGKSNAAQLSQQEKVLATLALMYERAGVQVDDLARTQDSTANRTRKLKADFEDFRIELAEGMLPTFAAIVDYLSDNSGSITTRARIAFAALAAGASDAWEILTDVAEVIGDIAEAVKEPIGITFSVTFTAVGEYRKGWRWLMDQVGVDTKARGNLVYDIMLGVPLAESKAQRRRERAPTGLNETEWAHEAKAYRDAIAAGDGVTIPISPTPSPADVKNARDQAEKILKAFNDSMRARASLSGQPVGRSVLTPEGRDKVREDRWKEEDFRAMGGVLDVLSPESAQGVVTPLATGFQDFFFDIQEQSAQTGAVIADVFTNAFGLILTDIDNIGTAFEALTKGFAAGIIQAVGQAAKTKAGENFAFAVEEGARALADAATGNFAGAGVHAKAALEFASAGAAWSALAGGAGVAASKVAGSARETGYGGNQGAGSKVVQSSEPKGQPIIIEIDPLNPDNPVHARQVGKAVDLDVRLGGKRYPVKARAGR